jgi:hypothetical protein
MPKDYTETNTALAVHNGLSVADSQVTITPVPDGGSWFIDERPPTVRRNGQKVALQMFRISPLPEDRSSGYDPPRNDVPVDGHTLESAIDHLLLCVYSDPKNPMARFRSLNEGTSPTGPSPM